MTLQTTGWSALPHWVMGDSSGKRGHFQGCHRARIIHPKQDHNKTSNTLVL